MLLWKLPNFAELANARLAKWLEVFGPFLRASPEPGAIFSESNQVTQRIPLNEDESEMQLILERYDLNDQRTIGKLYMDGRFFCWTLEDPISSELLPGGFGKIPGRTAIPAGDYQIVFQNSPKFGDNTLTLLDKRFYTHIRIHAGNRVEDTEGCILVGDKRGEDEIYQSRQALNRLKSLVTMPCWIAITEEFREQTEEKAQEKA